MNTKDIIKTETQPTVSRLIALAWTATLLASTLPYIIWKQFVPNNALVFDVAITALLLLLFIFAACIASLRPIQGYLLALIAFFFGWHIVIPLFSASPFWQQWQHHLSADLQSLFAYLVRFIPTVLMMFTLIGSHLGRKELFLTKGNLHAPVQVVRHLKFPITISWLRFAILFLLVAACVLPLYLSTTLHLKPSELGSVFIHLPTILIIAAFNSFNEEFQFRSIFLARLVPSLGQKQALWITTAIFALAHYYGEPSGVIGVILAGFAGYIWGMSILETRGIAFAWLLHFVQDVTILSFLFLATA